MTIQYTAIHGFYENRIMSLLHWLKQRANRDLKLISNQDTLSVLMSCQLLGIADTCFACKPLKTTIN